MLDVIYTRAAMGQDEWREEIKKMHTHTHANGDLFSAGALIKLISGISQRDTPLLPCSPRRFRYFREIC